ncbi:MAG: hypothetical protein HQK66_03125 [Desulfamplus sp.]|nr:hypothetical protein [Desulfamplus sp.]
MLKKLSKSWKIIDFQKNILSITNLIIWKAATGGCPYITITNSIIWKAATGGCPCTTITNLIIWKAATGGCPYKSRIAYYFNNPPSP